MTSHILYDGPSRIDGGPVLALAASVDIPSKNQKTGPMVQVYFLRKDMTPWEAVRTGHDASTCGNCIHRPKGENGSLRSCYVDLRFVNPVWYAKRVPFEPGIFEGRAVRVGTYGDPMSVPFEAIAPIFEEADMWTGYTQFWRESEDPRWRAHFMASVHSGAEAREARGKGWRTYRSRFAHEPVLKDEIECPHYARGVQCIDCNLCDGRSGEDKKDHRASISAIVHGNGARYFQRSPAAQRSLPL